MKCDQCQGTIEAGEEREHHSRTLCDDCYMDALSPAQGCDPWAVYLGTRTANSADGEVQVSENQAKILKIITEDGAMPFEAMLEKFEGRLSQSDLRKELAALRHMEKIRAAKQDGTVVIRLW